MLPKSVSRNKSVNEVLEEIAPSGSYLKIRTVKGQCFKDSGIKHMTGGLSCKGRSCYRGGTFRKRSAAGRGINSIFRNGVKGGAAVGMGGGSGKWWKN
uniref:Uncharacterized protein n=1 Tax=Nelumbo nucifera TaxID=4432 RepID=A0A822ZDE5_NELNU|nr:TPA_asm: hypothetical protein HUJ06_000823 [Nelumbo nucifera]